MTRAAYGIVERACVFTGKARSEREISNAKWDKQEAGRGDTLRLTADVKGIPDGTEANIEIFEYNEDGAHDSIERLSTKVGNSKIEAEWKFKYQEESGDTIGQEKMEHGINPPEYFFRVEAKGEIADSGLLKERVRRRLGLIYFR